MECEKNNWKNWNWKILPIAIYLKSSISMRYVISKATAPAMPKLGKGSKCVKLLLSDVEKHA